MKGVLSEGMLLAASTEGHGDVSLLTIDRKIGNGSRVG